MVVKLLLPLSLSLLILPPLLLILIKYSLQFFSRKGAQDLRGRMNSNRVLYLLKTERERDRENGTEDDDDRGNEVNSATHGGIGGAGRFR